LIHFSEVSQYTFLTEYWQKKPLLIKQALPNFISPITPDELAGFSLDRAIESRLIQGDAQSNQWQLKLGAFTENDFANLPEYNYTLLVQSLDRHSLEVADLINHFDFIPRWRFDDVMMSYAAEGGSVGPHFDFYDVFLLQSSGTRRWQLSSKHCTVDNLVKNAPLRIMHHFEPEQTFEVVAGDVLYIPAKIAHHGVSQSDDCTTLSFGYRAYHGAEFSEFLGGKTKNTYYQDPIWNGTDPTALIPKSAVQQANKLATMTDETFAKFVTQLDTMDKKNLQAYEFSMQGAWFDESITYQLHPSCNIAYLIKDNNLCIFLNGERLNTLTLTPKQITDFCNTRLIHNKQLGKVLFEAGLLV
jgi:50S ribosomal protein L16 3-hydroxylase